MPKNVVQYDLFIFCPGDITNEIRIIEDAVLQLGLTLKTCKYQYSTNDK